MNSLWHIRPFGFSLLLVGLLLFPAASTQAAPPPSDVLGKIAVGYQGWFSAKGDGSFPWTLMDKESPQTFYLRLTHDGAKMLKKLTPVQEHCPTPSAIVPK